MRSFVLILLSILSISRATEGQSEKIKEAAELEVVVSVVFKERTWIVTVRNNSKMGIQYVFNRETMAPRELGIEYWNQKNDTGAKVYVGDQPHNWMDGFGMDVRYIDPGESVSFNVDFLNVSSMNKNNTESWEKVCQLGLVDCRVFFKTYASPLYSVLFSEKKSEARIKEAHTQIADRGRSENCEK